MSEEELKSRSIIPTQRIQHHSHKTPTSSDLRKRSVTPEDVFELWRTDVIGKNSCISIVIVCINPVGAVAHDKPPSRYEELYPLFIGPTSPDWTLIAVDKQQVNGRGPSFGNLVICSTMHGNFFSEPTLTNVGVEVVKQTAATVLVKHFSVIRDGKRIATQIEWINTMNATASLNLAGAREHDAAAAKETTHLYNHRVIPK